MQEQNEKPISVIIGNPPYNDSQSNWYAQNPNRQYPEVDRRIKETYIKEGSAQRTHQYDMYKRFLRWASDRLADDGIIGFVTNRAYLETRQDDGFRRVAAGEFTDIYVMDLGSDVRRNPKISGTTHNVFGIQTGVAIAFFVREKAKRGDCGIHYVRREDAELAKDKLAYLKGSDLEGIQFLDITPDAKSNWLNQSDSDFDGLLPIANKQTKLRKASEAEQAIFELFSMGISTNRDDWVYDFDRAALSDKVEFFCGTYQAEMQRFGLEKPDPQSTRDWVTKSIKWTSELETHLVRGSQLTFVSQNIVPGVYQPFVVQHCYYAPIITHRRYQMPQIFPHGEGKQNKLICFCVNGKDFYALAVDKVANLHLTGDSQCLPLYRYTPDGERVSNITLWGIDRINGHYRREWGDDFQSLAGPEGITAEEIFAYTYAVLHDPVYRHDYAVDLLREFPRLPLYRDFHHWAEMGWQLLDLHIGFESAEPYPLERIEKLPAASGSPSTGSGRTVKTILRADKERGTISLDDATTLTGVPAAAWSYRLGSRSALEWVLDQYKDLTNTRKGSPATPPSPPGSTPTNSRTTRKR